MRTSVELRHAVMWVLQYDTPIMKHAVHGARRKAYDARICGTAALRTTASGWRIDRPGTGSIGIQITLYSLHRPSFTATPSEH